MSALSTMIRQGSRRRYYQSQQMLGPLQSSSSLSIPYFDNDDNNKHSTTIQNRSYHATNRNEILPFIAAGVLVGAGVYTFRTLQQIDKDWEDYYQELEEYKAVTGIDPEQESSSSSSNSNTTANRSDNADLSSFFTGGTLAIDIGTSRLKLSHQPSLSKNKNAKPSVIVDREGHRSTPAIAWKKTGEDILVGRLAASRSFDTRGGSIVHPQDVLLGNNNEQTDDNDIAAIQKTLRDVASNALDQVLGSSTGSSVKNSNNPLFVLDTSMSTPGSYNVRPIITYPAQSTATSSPPKQYQQALNGFTSPEGIAEYVSEPVAIVSGAEYFNLLPPTSSISDPVLVVDVGGTKTQVSMVSGDEVLHATSLPFGGDTYINLLVSKLAADFFGPSTENDDNSTDLSAKPRLNDPTALQRLYDASHTAVHELSNKTRSEINIPYLTMDLETRQPKHLEVGMSRNVVNSEFESWLKNKLVPHLRQSGSSSSLSQALPPSTNLSSLFSSVIMSALEQTSLTPMQLRAVLVVGGGARIPLMQSSMKESVGYLARELNKLVIPDGELLGELCVLGANWKSSQ